MFSVEFYTAECVKCGRKSDRFAGRHLLPKECSCGSDMLAIYESTCESGSAAALSIRMDFQHVLSARGAGGES